MLLLGLVVAGIFGTAALTFLLKARSGYPETGLLTPILGTGLGLALFSGLRFWCLQGSIPPAKLLEAGLALAATLAAIAIWWKKPTPAAPDLAVAGKSNLVCRTILIVLILAQIFMLVRLFMWGATTSPYGMYDAWSIWNYRGKVLMSPGDEWHRAFGPGMLHADYPLLLPLTAVRGWEWAGNTGPEATFAIGAAFFVLSAALLFAFLQALRGTTAGLVGLAVVLSTSPMLKWGPCQYADIPLSFFYLASLGSMAFACRNPARSGPWLAVLGLSLSAAAWTKNEGIAWAVLGIATTFGVILFNGLPRSGILWFLAGLAPLGATVLFFKLTLAGPGDLFGDLSGITLSEKFADLRRHNLIWQFIQRYTPRWVIWLPVYMVLLGFRRAEGIRLSSLWISIQLAAILIVYYLVYLITPHDLIWHLWTSGDRLAIQVWPGILFLMLSIVRTPEEVLASTNMPCENGVNPEAR